MDKKFFARACASGMWLGQGLDGGWKAFQDFGKAWPFDSKDLAEKMWDDACLSCLVRCSKSHDPVPAWAISRAVILRGHTPEGMPGSFDYYLGIIDGRFVAERPSGLSLSTDETEAKVFGSLDEAKRVVMLMRTAKCKSLAVLPMSCRAEHPIELDGAKLDALAAASYARRLREEWGGEVSQASESLEKNKRL